MGMLSKLIISTLMLAMTLVIPGYAINRKFGLKPVLAFASAPGITLSVLSLLALVLAATGVKASFQLIMLCSLTIVVTCLATTTIRRGVSAKVVSVNEASAFMVFICVTIGISFVIFSSCLDGPDSYFQGWDNIHHLDSIRTFINSGNWSSFGDFEYAPNESSPFSSSVAFYPSAWHMLAAFLASTYDIPVTTAANVCNFLSIAWIYSLGFYALVHKFGVKGPFVSALAAIICVGVPASTWGLLTYGPLFPNLLGMALLPAGIACFMELLRLSDDEVYFDVSRLIPFLIYIVGMTFAHPNSVFTLAVMLLPYVIVCISRLLRLRNAPKAVYAWLAPTLVALAAALIWFIAYRVPYINRIASVSWPSIASPLDAFIDAVTLGVVGHPGQIVVALLAFFGGITLLRDRKHIWILLSGLLVVLIYVFDAGTDGFLKHLLSGFWYTDYNRTGAMVGFVASILACTALANIQLKIEFERRLASVSFLTLACLSFASVIFYPNFMFVCGGKVNTAFGYETTELANQYNKSLIYYDVLSPIEEEFCRDICTKNCGSELILNNPQDGSIFGYSVYGLNMFYRDCQDPSELETEESRLIRLHLNEYAYNVDVQKAVANVGAKYVLQLDAGDESSEYRITYANDIFEKWDGINKITDSTPGFRLIASTDDIRLYEILALA